MKVLLLKDVYKLGRAGDIKKVADGYGRNFLLPQKLAVLASPGALKQVEKIRSLGIVLGQGFFFSKPVPFGELLPQILSESERQAVA